MGASASIVQVPALTLEEFISLRDEYESMSNSPLLFSEELISSEIDRVLLDIQERKLSPPVAPLLDNSEEEGKVKVVSVAELEKKFHEWTFAGKGDPLPLTVKQAKTITEGYKTIALSWKRSNIDKCIEYLEKIYKIQTNVIGFPHPQDRDTACYQIARLCYSEKKLEQALAYFKECMKLRIGALLELESFTPDNSRYDAGDGRVEPPLAVEIEREALKELRKTQRYKDAALKVATIRNDLGILYAAMTRRDKAFQEGTTLRWIPYYKESVYNFHQALDIRLTMLGNHVLVANVYQGLGAISKEGMSKTIDNELLKERLNGMEIQKCVQYYEKSLSIREELVPANDKSVIYTKKKLADAHYCLANIYFLEKENCLQAAYKGYSDSYNMRDDVEKTFKNDMTSVERQLLEDSQKKEKSEKGAGFVDDLRKSVEAEWDRGDTLEMEKEAAVEENKEVELTLPVDCRIEAHWKQKLWLKGVITRASDGTYDVEYDDDTMDYNLPQESVRAVLKAPLEERMAARLAIQAEDAMTPLEKTIAKEQKLKAERLAREEEWDRLDALDAEKKAEQKPETRTYIPKDDGGFFGDCYLKDYEARPFTAQNDRDWYPCIVSFMHPNNSFTVLIKEQELPSSPNAATLTLLKECVQTKINDDPKKKNDEPQELAREVLGVSAENVRKKGQTKSMSELANTAKPRKKMVEGSVIDGNFRNRGKYLPGKIVSKYPTGKFDVEYDNGFVEKQVLQKCLRWPQSPQETITDKALLVPSRSADPASPTKKKQIDKAELVLTSLSSMPFEWKETHIDQTVDINHLVNQYKDNRRDKLVANQKMQQVKAAIIKARDIELERASKRPMHFEDSKTVEKDEEVQAVARQSQLMSKMFKKKEKADMLMKRASEQKESQAKKEREREVAELLEDVVEKTDIQHEITHCLSGILDDLDRSELNYEEKIKARANDVARIKEELFAKTAVAQE